MEIVEENEVIEYAKNIDAIYGKVSALNKEGIDDSMELIFNKYLEYIKYNPIVKEENEGKILDFKELKQKKICC